jgi:hypothetical protein
MENPPIRDNNVPEGEHETVIQITVRVLCAVFRSPPRWAPGFRTRMVETRA